MSDTYTIHMRGKTFELTRDQIEFDSPNYFTSCFFGDFTESHTRTLTLSCDPGLFRIVLDHLSGYRVLPLHESVIPERMNSETALDNLLADAQFYQLDALIEDISHRLLESKFVDLPPQSPCVLLNYLIKPDGRSSWGPIVFVSEVAARRMQEEHEVSQPVVFALAGGLEPEIHNVLINAGVPTSYMMEGYWLTDNTKMSCHTYLLRLVK